MSGFLKNLDSKYFKKDFVEVVKSEPVHVVRFGLGGKLKVRKKERRLENAAKCQKVLHFGFIGFN